MDGLDEIGHPGRPWRRRLVGIAARREQAIKTLIPGGSATEIGICKCFHSRSPEWPFPERPVGQAFMLQIGAVR